MQIDEQTDRHRLCPRTWKSEPFNERSHNTGRREERESDRQTYRQVVRQEDRHITTTKSVH